VLPKMATKFLHYLSEVNLKAGLRVVTHAPTSPQIGSEATAGFDGRSDVPRTLQQTGQLEAAATEWQTLF
jgi:hypothetical protein